MLEVNVEKMGSATVLYLEGRIVSGNETAILREAVSAEIGPSVVLLDLAKVELIDAGGLGLLLELRGLIQSRGIEFRLMNVAQLVRQVLEIACLDSVFDISNKDMTLAAHLENDKVRRFRRRLHSLQQNYRSVIVRSLIVGGRYLPQILWIERDRLLLPEANAQ